MPQLSLKHLVIAMMMLFSCCTFAPVVTAAGTTLIPEHVSEEEIDKAQDPEEKERLKIQRSLVHNFKTGKFELYDLGGYIQYLIEFLIYIAGGIAVLFIVIGGYKYIIGSVSDDKDAGKKTIQYALGGFIVVLLSWTIVNFAQVWFTSGSGRAPESYEEEPEEINDTGDSGATAQADGQDCQDVDGAWYADGDKIDCAKVAATYASGAEATCDLSSEAWDTSQCEEDCGTDDIDCHIEKINEKLSPLGITILNKTNKDGNYCLEIPNPDEFTAKVKTAKVKDDNYDLSSSSAAICFPNSGIINIATEESNLVVDDNSATMKSDGDEVYLEKVEGCGDDIPCHIEEINEKLSPLGITLSSKTNKDGNYCLQVPNLGSFTAELNGTSYDLSSNDMCFDESGVIDISSEESNLVVNDSSANMKSDGDDLYLKKVEGCGTDDIPCHIEEINEKLSPLGLSFSSNKTKDGYCLKAPKGFKAELDGISYDLEKKGMCLDTQGVIDAATEESNLVVDDSSATIKSGGNKLYLYKIGADSEPVAECMVESLKPFTPAAEQDKHRKEQINTCEAKGGTAKALDKCSDSPLCPSFPVWRGLSNPVRVCIICTTK